VIRIRFSVEGSDKNSVFWVISCPFLFKEYNGDCFVRQEKHERRMLYLQPADLRRKAEAGKSADACVKPEDRACQREGKH